MKVMNILMAFCVIFSSVNIAEARRGGGSRSVSTVKTTKTTVKTAPAAKTKTTNHTSHGNHHQQCGTKRYCSQMNSCSEAKYYLNTCGVASLDRNNDGVPCESLCR